MDILNCIQEDRAKIRMFIADLNSEYASPEWKYGLFRELALIAESHAKAFEATVLDYAKGVEELRPMALESLEKNAIMDDLINKIRITEDPDVREARVKVLTGLLEAQFNDEERRLLADVHAHLEVLQTPAFTANIKERYERRKELGLGQSSPRQLRFFSPLLNEAG